jgi:Family of unknown function (DUF6104)
MACMKRGIDRLRAKRGSEQVTFADVADHLVDFAEREPECGDAIDRLAHFLAGVEDVDHDHGADPERGLGPVEADPGRP